jgi:hypothetical protein
MLGCQKLELDWHAFFGTDASHPHTVLIAITGIVKRMTGASAWRDAAMGVFGIRWRVVSTGSAFLICQFAGSADADRAGHSANRASKQYADRPSNCGIHGVTCSRACHQATPHQGRR